MYVFIYLFTKLFVISDNSLNQVRFFVCLFFCKILIFFFNRKRVIVTGVGFCGNRKKLINKQILRALIMSFNVPIAFPQTKII